MSEFGVQTRVDELLTVMCALAEGKLDARVNNSAADESSELQATLDGICTALNILAEELQATVIRKEQYEVALGELQQTQSELVHTAKLASLGELAAGVAHELNQPLQIVGLAVDEVRDALEDGDLEGAHEYLETIEGQVSRGAGVVGRLLSFSRRHYGTPSQAMGLDAIINEAIAMLGGQLSTDGIALDAELESTVERVACKPDELLQVLTNLIINARDAVLDRDERRIIIRTTDMEGAVCVEVQDSGVGIPADDLPRVFDPFFTTKPVGQGTGLGLSVSHGIIRRCGGTIEALSEPGQGTRMRVTLPVQSVSETP